MSTLNLGQLVTLLQQRVPVGLSSTYCKERLNEAFRWISQQDSFVWALRRAPVTVAAATVDFSLPVDADPGDIMALYGAANFYKTAIPFIPFDQWSLQETFNQPMPTNTFSAWTIIHNGTTYKGKLAPSTALIAPVSLNLFYHINAEQLTLDAQFYPTPPDFDSILADLAEAEVRRVYHMAGWESIQAKATEEAKDLMAQYRSSKKYIEGVQNEAMGAQEAQLKRAQ